MTQNPRMKAAKQKRKRYDGKACPRGHGTERYTINGQCVVCVAKAASARRAEIRALLDSAVSD